MNTNRQASAGMPAERKTALAAGILYLLTFVSIPIGFLYYAVLNDPNYIVGSGSDTPIIIGCILEIIVALASIGTVVAPYPVLKKQYEGVALGLGGSRVLEASTIGPLFVLTGIGVLPIALFEFSLGVWLIVKGFNPSAITYLSTKPATTELVSAA